MNNLQIFSNEEFGDIRIAIVGGEPVFCLVDVCRILGLTTPANVKKRLKPKGMYTIHTLTNGGRQELIFIDEPNLYRAVMQSRKKEAEKFVDWIVEEVLPSIRKSGSYSLQPSYTIENLLNDPDALITALQAYKVEREQKLALQAENKTLESQIAVMQPKVNYCDQILQSVDLIPITTIAKDYGLSGQELNNILRDAGVQFKQGKIWHLYQKYAEMGLAQSKSFPIEHTDGKPGERISTYWTPQGRLFIYELLKKQGILPIVERPRQLELLPYDFGGTWS